MSAAAVWVK
jgi:hypothetical protein